MMEQEVSYRQVGREKGYAPPPRLDKAGEKRRRSSSERNGFGNRTQRFGTISNDIPPPGAYFRRSTLERDSRTCGSVSSKGYGGGFVSAVPRFRNVKALQEAYLPGPGTYIGQSEARSEGAKLTSFSSLKRDCGFTDNPEHAVPGPGQYNLDRKETQRLGSGPTSSFRCARKPLENERSCDTPAPGAYELATPVHPRVDKNGQVLKAPFFRSQTKRDASFISGSEVPGPGEYDIDRGMTIAKESSLLPVVAGHAGKRPGGRFGQDDDCQEEASVSPGPGWYTPHQTKSAEKSSASSSMFRSATRRFAEAAVAGAPGPAFYHPEPLGKKSFLWNANKQWV